MMKMLVTSADRFGPFNAITEDGDGFLCNGELYYPKSVIGSGQIESVQPADLQPATPTGEEFDALVAKYDAMVQGRLERAAQDFKYTSMASAVSYADEPAVPKFQAEGQLLRAWRSLYWAACWPVLEAVRTGQRPVPTPEVLLAELDEAAPPPTVAQVNAKIAELTA